MGFRLCEVIRSKNVDCLSNKVDRIGCVIVAARVSSLRVVPFSEIALDRMSSSSRKKYIETPLSSEREACCASFSPRH